MEAVSPDCDRVPAGDRYVVVAEMHDLVTHDLAQLTVQMAAARRLLGHDPAQAGRLLADAEATARSAVAEMRRTAEILPSPDPGTHRPLPGLADLDTLVAEAAAAGVELEIRRTGVLPPLRAVTQLATYRIVEAAARCTPRGWRVRAVVGGGDRSVRIEVRHRAGDGGTAGRPELDELRRRADLYGGRLRYFPDDDGRLAVEFPLERTHPA
ncbi:histidine kinase [Georgenia subflava]|uniref:Signal transduction histidine kinase subgroup 3 dimerisation and phosphoacceptor domain-containing protein n=1 Tax=Georgenia subflava TaxID=1622177 RepID=A0A6N7EN81_9MICO|nr:histidine kinase [Georgenia subflava]MPV36664.1 hypothetical protein [Georgenia subflava]